MEYNECDSIIKNWRQASEQQWHSGRWTRWIKGFEMPGYNESKTVVCGHYPTIDSEIHYGDGFIKIDAGTDARKKVNVLVLQDQLKVKGE